MMAKTYLEISIPAEPGTRELLIPFLLEIGCTGFLETDPSLLAYIDKSTLTPGEFATFRNRLSGILRSLGAGEMFDIREIAEENWNQRWEMSITPVEIGDSFVIKPSWHSIGEPSGRIVIEIDPKMSFGTGHHETTRLCLRLMEQYMKQGDRVLDVGTGTGLLAIAALKLGAQSAVGIDVDDWSIENALENVKANRVEERVQILRVPIEDFRSEDVQGGGFDCILANLTLRMITDSLSHLHALAADEGIVILSGFLETDLPAIRLSLAEHRFQEAGRLDEHGWSALAARKA
jgi:ribosomal protein L11 methyltransferase